MPEVLTLSSVADAEPDLSTFENKTGLAEDMKFLASMPELCDVTFLVGDTREPVCAVKVCIVSAFMGEFITNIMYVTSSNRIHNKCENLIKCHHSYFICGRNVRYSS